ncbi:hypothetical protein SEA_FLAGSTAFF_52 [Mycobacterium phage FlagStaff]|uniref:DUF7459 domain-containing protein n=1 Tax=Mycobacterium phage FlagStaff TaxID=1647304 RepID=A0A0F6YQL8_9CAUD|nr:hypothetical protein AVT49_gp52 [Mycobacterium phage FlagStaff]AKF14489.1 hypothetical protein SEA_FLAGSTAFF_52 [Mycobacterium phage FlagStaff]
MEFTEPRSGWAAECEDCPFTIGEDYGQRIYPRWEFDDTDDGRHLAERWAIQHRTANPGHSPTVNQFHRWTMTHVEHLDVKLLATLFGTSHVPQRVMLNDNPSCQHRMIANSTGECVACGERMEAVEYRPEYVTSAPNAAAGLCANGPDCDGGEGCTAVYVPDVGRARQVLIGTDVLYRCRRCSNNGTTITADQPIEWDCGHDHRGDRLPAR